MIFSRRALEAVVSLILFMPALAAGANQSISLAIVDLGYELYRAAEYNVRQIAPQFLQTFNGKKKQSSLTGSVCSKQATTTTSPTSDMRLRLSETYVSNPRCHPSPAAQGSTTAASAESAHKRRRRGVELAIPPPVVI